MKKYTGTKTLMARPMTRGEYNTYRGWEIPADENPNDPGYLVEYELVEGEKQLHPDHKGYISWSPASVFEKSYRVNGCLSIGDAVIALKQGKRVARIGWNGKGMFLFLLPAGDGIPTKVIHDPALRAVIESEVGGETFDALGSVRMFTADKKILTGWLASQSDLLAEDWEILD
jgi:hypothetical protein